MRGSKGGEKVAAEGGETWCWRVGDGKERGRWGSEVVLVEVAAMNR